MTLDEVRAALRRRIREYESAAVNASSPDRAYLQGLAVGTNQALYLLDELANTRTGEGEQVDQRTPADED